MNTHPLRPPESAARYSPFWACLLVFALLAADTAFRLVGSARQRKQLDALMLQQQQEIGRLRPLLQQLGEVEGRLQGLSLELLQMAQTNATASQIVREFGIQWTPAAGGAPAAAVTAPSGTGASAPPTNAPAAARPASAPPARR
jgi:TolA-binding protein